MKNKYMKFLAGASARRLTIIFLLPAFFSLSSYSQDILKLKSGKELKVIIVEENENAVKYREFENQSGPVYTVKKENVESVKYKKGKAAQAAKDSVQVKDNSNKASSESGSNGEPLLTAKKRAVYIDGVAQSSRSIRLLMEDNPEALKNFDSAKKLFKASNACPFVIMGLSLIATNTMNGMEEQSDRLKIGIPVLCVDAGLIVAGIILASKGKAKLQKSVSLYNSAVSKPVQASLSIGLQDNGVGIALKF
jgi:hypothetical protein